MENNEGVVAMEENHRVEKRPHVYYMAGASVLPAFCPLYEVGTFDPRWIEMCVSILGRGAAERERERGGSAISLYIRIFPRRVISVNPTYNAVRPPLRLLSSLYEWNFRPRVGVEIVST